MTRYGDPDGGAPLRHDRFDAERERRRKELRALSAKKRKLLRLVKKAKTEIAAEEKKLRHCTSQARHTLASLSLRIETYSSSLSKLQQAQNLASIKEFALQASGVFKRLNGKVVCLPNIPCAAGVYAQMLNGKIIRIGATAGGFSRAFHQSFVFDAIAFMPCAPEDMADLERALYKIERPELNAEHDLKKPLTEPERIVFEKYCAVPPKKSKTISKRN